MADIGASNWNETDASNSTAAPDGAPEGMAPSGVNDTMRAMMGATKRWYDWTTPKTTGGTATAYTLTYSVAPGALVDGMTHLVQFNAANGTSATLNVNALGAIPLHYYSSVGAGGWIAAPPGLFEANEIFRVAYNVAAGAYRIMRPGADRTGVIKPFAGSTVPGGYLLCYGQAVSRTTYAGLFNTIGTQFGTGDGSTTFNIPDLRGRMGVGKDDMGGSAANRITGTTIPSSPILGSTGGAQTNTASTTVSGTTSGSVAVTKDAPFADAAAGGSGNSYLLNSSTLATTGSLSVSASGTSSAFSVVQPSIVLNQIIAI